MDYSSILTDFYANPVAYAVVVVALAFASAYVLKYFILRWARSLAKRTRTKLDDIIVAETSKAVTLLIYLLAVYLLAIRFTPISLVEEVLLALAVLVSGRAVINITIEAFREYIDLLPLEKDHKDVILGAEGYIKALLYILIVLVMLASVGIDIWPIITSLGIGGLAISMALKDVLTDYVAGIIIILGRSLKKGQRVLVKDKGVEGIIEEVGWRYTTLRTDEGEVVTIPNRVMSSSVVIFKK